jgi:hypothetical protein
MSDPLGWHYDVIPMLARALRPQVYVELGVREANLFNLVAPFAETAIGVDIDPASGTCIEDRPNVRFRCCTSDEFLEEIERSGLLIDLLFIDADHSRAASLRDFQNYLPHVRPQGLILMHDTHPGDASMVTPTQCGEVCRAVEELSGADPGYEMVTIPLSPGVTICRKRTRQLSWEEPDTGVAPAAWGGVTRVPVQPELSGPQAGSAPGDEAPSAPPRSTRRLLSRMLVSLLGEERFNRMRSRLRRG